MRITYRFTYPVVIAGRHYGAVLRPMQKEDQLKQQRYGVQGQERMRLILPPDAIVFVRDEMELNGKHYLCCGTRTYPGHLQADFRRVAG